MKIERVHSLSSDISKQYEDMERGITMSITIKGLKREYIEQYVDMSGDRGILCLEKLIPLPYKAEELDIVPCEDFDTVFRSRLRKAQMKYGKIKTTTSSWLNNGYLSWGALKYYVDVDKWGTDEFYDYLKTVDGMIEAVMYEIEQQKKVSAKVKNVYTLLKNLKTYGYTTLNRLKYQKWGMIDNPEVRFVGDDIIFDNNTSLLVVKLARYLSYRYCCDVVMQCVVKDWVYTVYYINGEKVFINYKKAGV